MIRHLSIWLMAGFALNGWLLAVEATGPPKPVPYKKIPDPPDDAERHIVVKAADRGPVWLLTGFLGRRYAGMDYKILARVKPKYWRDELWPLWYPRERALGDALKPGGGLGGSLVSGDYLETKKRLQHEFGMRWQVILHHARPYYNLMTLKADARKRYYDDVYALVKYCRRAQLPADSWEVINEPPTIRKRRRPGGYAFQGTWEEFLVFWDINYDAIRAADPEAKIAGPSFGGPEVEEMEAFLSHCRQKGQRLDILSWHINCIREGPNGEYWEDCDYVHRNISEMRELVKQKFPDLGIKEYHLDEWSYYIPYGGTGSQIAYFYYMDLAGLDRAAKTHPPKYLNGIMLNARTPRAAYWAWVEYAKQDGGLRLVSETNDHNLVALASRHDQDQVVRVLVARAKKMAAADPPQAAPAWKWGHEPPAKPPVTVRVHLEGLPLSEGKAEVSILRLPPGYGPLYESQLPALTTTRVMPVVDATLTLELDKVVEDNVLSIVIGPEGTYAKERQRDAAWTAAAAPVGEAVSEKRTSRIAAEQAAKDAKAGVFRVNCGASRSYLDAAGHGWFADRRYEPGKFGHVGGEGIQRGPITVAGTDNPEIYRSELWGHSAYRITIPSGRYVVRLHFCETFGSNRKFDVMIEGRKVLDQFNPLARAGGRNLAVVVEFSTQISDGVLDIDFVNAEGAPPAIINAIEVRSTGDHGGGAGP